jgi:transposase
MDGATNAMNQVQDQLAQVMATLNLLMVKHAIKDWYSTQEVAQLLNKSAYTVREWCRNQRVRGEKKNSGRGKHQSWVISHQELLRIQKEGLLPPSWRP